MDSRPPAADSSDDPTHIVVELSLSVEAARRVIWEGTSPQQPIGELLDSREITYSDLAGAVHGATSSQVRAAAQTLLADWLGQATTRETVQRFGPQVIIGSRFLENAALNSAVRASGFLGAVCVALVALIVIAIVILTSNQQIPVVVAIGTLTAAGLTWVLFRDAEEKYRRFASFRKGHQGEEEVIERLRTTLDHRWTIFRNLYLPDHRGDIDAVLVGPGGVFALEVKAYTGAVRLRRGQWERRIKRTWSPMTDNPSEQAKRNAQRLIDFARQQGVSLLWVEPVVVISEPHAAANFEVSDVAVWLPATVGVRIGTLRAHTLPSESEIKRMTAALKKVARDRMAVEKQRRV